MIMGWHLYYRLVLLCAALLLACSAENPDYCDDQISCPIELTCQQNRCEDGLRLRVTRSGEGIVTSSPSGIRCGAPSGSCEADFAGGVVVTLTATALPNSSFFGWSGACVSEPCVISGSGASQVNAAFAPCGAPMQPCCRGAGCGSGLECKSGACQPPCGFQGGACCPPSGCNAGLTCTSGVCQSPQACGAQGQGCCAGSACNANLSCQGGACQPCGGGGQICCPGGCNANLSCQGGVCQPCGGGGQVCCANNSCGSGLVCEGVCQPTNACFVRCNSGCALHNLNLLSQATCRNQFTICANSGKTCKIKWGAAYLYAASGCCP